MGMVCVALAIVRADGAHAQVPAYVTQWGSSGAGDGQFSQPIGVALDAHGNVYVSDLDNSRIQKFASDGVYLAQWAKRVPAGLAIAATGNLYVASPSVVEKLTLDGTSIALWTSLGPIGGTFWLPWAVAVDGDGNVYVSDVGSTRIRVLASDGTYLRDLNGQFASPYGIAVGPGGRVYVADLGHHRVQEFTSGGTLIRQWGSHGTGSGEFDLPYGLAVDAAGHVYVTDKGNHRIQVFTADGVYLAQWGGLGSGNGQFQAPTGIAVDAAGNVYVADAAANRIQKFGPLPTSAARRTWGALKSLYHGERTE
jgi:DNA-binding beta-propeller fold protein YncE